MEVGILPLVTYIWYSSGWVYSLQAPEKFQKSSNKQAGRHWFFTNKLLISRLAVLKIPAGVVFTLGFCASSCWWWVSFLWRTSECFSRWEWGRQLTVSLMDSAAAKRLDSADTHWPRESSKRTMTITVHEKWSSAVSHTAVYSEDRQSGES